MKKTRILILMHYMELGGAESALLGLLQSVDPNRVDVDVFLYDHRGELLKYIPTDKVRLLPEKRAYKMIERPIAECVRNGQIGVAFGRLLARQTVDKSPVPKGKDDIRVFSRIADCVEPFLPKIQPTLEYDLAISFLMPHNYVLSKVKAKKKVGWIHTDYSTVYVDVKRELPVWERLDHIATISDEVGKKFVETFPTLKGKIIPIENILCSSFIRRRAIEFVPTDMSKNENCVNLLSIGRFSYPKRFDQVGTICRKIQAILSASEQPSRVHWYIIGFGDERKIVENIEEEGMQEYVTILGKRANPYPYIKACDVYVQPSRYEGKSITVREAQILCKPVVVSNYPTAASQVQSGVDGVIVPMEIDDCAKGIATFIGDNGLQDRIVGYLRSHDYGNEAEIEKIYQLAGA